MTSSLEPARAPANGKGASKLSDHAYFAVRNAILAGDLGFGQAVTRRGLAAQLGMSLPPVTEALQKLEYEGLVRSVPRVGTRVCTPAELDIAGHLVVREALEGRAALEFAQAATDSQRAELRSLAARLDREFGAPEPDREAYAELHERVHIFIAECTGYPALTDIVQRQLTLWRWLGSRLAWEPTARCLEDEEHLPRDWHESLAAALSQGDPVLAERTMRHHVRRGMKVIAKSVGSVPATAAAANGSTAARS